MSIPQTIKLCPIPVRLFSLLVILLLFTGVGYAVNNEKKLFTEPHILFMEDFSTITGDLSGHWSLTGNAHPWSIQSSSHAGGHTPELNLTWSPSTTGTSRLTSQPIDVKPGTRLRLRLKQQIRNFHLEQGETAAIAITFAGNDSLVVLWENQLQDDVEQAEYEFYFEVPAESNALTISFMFSGNNYNIWDWYIDDIVLESLRDHQLEIVSLYGNTIPSAGREEIYTVQVRNSGLKTIENYTVSLVHENGSELAALEGIPIAFGDTLLYQFPWSPTQRDIGKNTIRPAIKSTHQSDSIMGEPLELLIQPKDIYGFTLAEGDERNTLPINFLWHNSLSQSVYPAKEIPVASGYLTGIMYQGFFSEDFNNTTLQIWVGESDSSNLEQGWIEPGTLTRVLDTVMDLDAGEQNIFLPFDIPYAYRGNNLVVMAVKNHEEWSSDNYFLTREAKTEAPVRRVQRDNIPYNPSQLDEPGATSMYLPMMSVFFASQALILRDLQAEGADNKEQRKELPEELQELFRQAIETATEEHARQQKEQQQEQEQQEQQIQQEAGSAYDGIEITEFIFNETMTKLGADFYYFFFQQWRNPTNIEGLSIYVIEKPLPGMGGIISIKVEDRIVFQSMLRPNVQQIRDAATAAVQRTQSYFVNYKQIQEQLDGDDQSGTGIY